MGLKYNEMKNGLVILEKNKLFIVIYGIILLLVILVDEPTLSVILILPILFGYIINYYLGLTLGLMTVLIPIQGLSVVLVLLIILAFSIIYFLININTIATKIEKRDVLFSFIFLLIGIISLLFSNEQNINLYILLFMSILTYNTIVVSVKNNKALFNYLFIGLITISLVTIITLFPLLLSAEPINRLRLDGSVRQLANLLALPTVLLIISLIQDYQKKKLLKIGFSILFLSFIIMTVSRGVIIAIFLSLIPIVKRFFGKARNVVILSIVILALLYIYQNILVDTFDYTRYKDIFDNSARNSIWLNVLQLMTIKEFILGLGIGNFSMFYYENFFIDYYAHSVFLDTFFSLGILGFLIIVFFILGKLIKCKSSSELSLLLFVIILFLPHGNIQDYTFWIYLGIAVSYSKLNG